jgi:hypothetical protein
MSWESWLLHGDFGQVHDEIRHMKKSLIRLHGISGKKATKEALLELEKENDELKLYVAAIIRLLVRKGIASAEEIRQMVEAIDIEDGVADGKREGDLLGSA